jgi:hypothetical protein
MNPFNNEVALATSPIAVMIKGKRNMFLPFRATFETDAIKAFIDNSISGSANFLKLSKPISAAFK